MNIAEQSSLNLIEAKLPTAGLSQKSITNELGAKHFGEWGGRWWLRWISDYKANLSQAKLKLEFCSAKHLDTCVHCCLNLFLSVSMSSYCFLKRTISSCKGRSFKSMKEKCRILNPSKGCCLCVTRNLSEFSAYAWLKLITANYESHRDDIIGCRAGKSNLL